MRNSASSRQGSILISEISKGFIQVFRNGFAHVKIFPPSLTALVGGCGTAHIFHKLIRIRLDAGKNRLEAERARLLEEKSEAGNRVGFDSLGQNQRVFEAFGLILSRRPTVSDSLQERFVKANLQRSLQPSPKTIFITEIMMLTSEGDN